MVGRISERGKPPSRPMAHLGASLEKSLSTYALAVASAGVSFLASAPPADAKIVYTPAQIDIPANGTPIPLDLNHDGLADFSFLNTQWGGSEGAFINELNIVGKTPSNKMRGRGSWYFWLPKTGSHKNVFASALPPGFSVGPNKSHFQKASYGVLVQSGGNNYGAVSYGQWWYTQHRYLGLKFAIKGQTHYGWARLNVTFLPKQGIQATLTGYAYETVPNKPIVTGKTKGPDVITVEPSSLGALAAGKK